MPWPPDNPVTGGIPLRTPVPLGELLLALEQNRISARYQPVVRMSDRVPVALEVLARLEHPSRGTVPPDLFVPQMEDAGLAWPLTQAVVRRAFGEWQAGPLRALGLSLALNVPLDVMLFPEALDWLDQACGSASIPRPMITIELTESQPLRQLDQLRAAAGRLRASGYALAIDDVGPAVRDHRELLDFAFSVLKLDKDLVRGSATDPAANDFLLQSIAAARAARLTIIAEGVEDEAVWDRMASLGIELAQGYLIAKPLAAEDVPAWYRAWRGAASHAAPAAVQ